MVESVESSVSHNPETLETLGERDPAPAPMPERLPAHDEDPGRLAMYAVFGATAFALPLPWVPDIAARWVRGALVQGVASRLGVVLTPDARDVLAEPAGTEGPRGPMRQATAFATRLLLRRLGPGALLVPLRNAVSVFALGHLFRRYLETGRRATGPLDAAEARRVRRAIDRAVLYFISMELPIATSLATRSDAHPVGDMRDATTQWIDAFFDRATALPSWTVRRLDQAFDQVLPTTDG